MLRKISMILLVMACLICFWGSNYVYADEKCKLYIEDITKYLNSNNVVVNIYMENVNTQITTLGLNLEYDNSKLKFISSKAGKELHATVKLAQNMQEKGKVSIGALALDGFKNDGLYYSITFQVLDDSSDIPIKLSKREITDKDGNNVEIQTQGAIIKISKEITTIEKSPENQKIESFEISDEIEYDNLDTYIQEQGKIEVLGNDTLVYEIQNSDIVEIQDDGTIIPIKDGTTNVRVRLNNEAIGNVAIEIGNKEIKTISATDEIKEFQATSSSQDVNLIETNIEQESKLTETIINENKKKFNNTNNRNNEIGINKHYVDCAAILLLILMFILTVFFILKVKRKKGGRMFK